jgi:hypothetical protein
MYQILLAAGCGSLSGIGILLPPPRNNLWMGRKFINVFNAISGHRYHLTLLNPDRAGGPQASVFRPA